MLAALDLFKRKGYEQTSIQDLADRAGIGKSTVYSYFHNKSEIFLAFCEDEYRRTSAEFSCRLDMGERLVEKLLSYFLAEFDVIMANGEFGRLLLRETLFPSDTLLQKGVHDLDSKYIDLLTPCFEAAQQRGELRQDVEMSLVIGQFYAMYLLTVSCWFTNRLQTREDVAQGMEALFEQAMAGLAVHRAETL